VSYVLSFYSPIYRVIQEEMSILSDVISVIVRKRLFDFVSYVLSFYSSIYRVIQEKMYIVSDVIL